jgi:hypothetical protein
MRVFRAGERRTSIEGYGRGAADEQVFRLKVSEVF